MYGFGDDIHTVLQGPVQGREVSKYYILHVFQQHAIQSFQVKKLQVGEIDLVPYQDCANQWRPYFIFVTEANHICGGGPVNQIRACTVFIVVTLIASH